MFNYEPLCKTMTQKGITQYQLIKEHHFSTGTLDTLKKNRNVTACTLEKLCLILDCTPNDIMQVIKDH